MSCKLHIYYPLLNIINREMQNIQYARNKKYHFKAFVCLGSLKRAVFVQSDAFNVRQLCAIKHLHLVPVTLFIHIHLSFLLSDCKCVPNIFARKQRKPKQKISNKYMNVSALIKLITSQSQHVNVAK